MPRSRVRTPDLPHSIASTWPTCRTPVTTRPRRPSRLLGYAASVLSICPYHLSLPSVLTICPYHLSLPSVLTICPYHLSLPSVLTICPYHLSLPSVLTICPYHLSLPSVFTICPYHRSTLSNDSINFFTNCRHLRMQPHAAMLLNHQN